MSTPTITRRTAQLIDPVDCTTCPAVGAEPCTTEDGTAKAQPHVARIAALHALADAAHAIPVGFLCMNCNRPAPWGVGYRSVAIGSYWNSIGRAACDCGWSVAP